MSRRRKPFKAEVLFPDPADVPNAVEVLTKFFELHYEVIPTEDPDEPTAFGFVSGMTELDESAIGDWLREILQPINGEVCEWGYSWRFNERGVK
jgi:hypothetical protein